jgi:hypothetical protein
LAWDLKNVLNLLTYQHLRSPAPALARRLLFELGQVPVLRVLTGAGDPARYQSGPAEG